MTPHTNKTPVRFATLALLGMLFAPATNSSIAGSLAKLTITPEKGERDGFFLLNWDAAPGAVYRVQSSTNLNSNLNWRTIEPVTADGTNASLEIRGRSIPENSVEFFRLEAHPEILSVEPAFIDSSDSNAVLYILGQLLPTNAVIEVNGMQFTPTIINSNGVWASVRLNGLPSGIPVTGTLRVIDAGTSNVVATLPIQSPILYGTEMTAEQLQGTPEDPLAAPFRPIGRITFKAKEGATLARGLADFNVTQQVTPEEPMAAYFRPIGRITFKAKEGATLARRLVPEAPIKVTLDGDPLKEETHFREVTGLDVQPPTGELRYEKTDLAIPGRGLDFIWARTYRSRTGPTTAQGHGWDFSYNVSITQQPDGTVQLRPGNGRTDTFYPNGTNGWSRDEYFVEVRDLNGDGMPDVLFPDTGKWLFNPLTPGTPGGGKLSRIVDRNGNTISLYYDSQDRCDQIVDTLGRTNVIAYNSTGLLESVTDFSGRVVRYEYDGNGDLTSCVSPAVTGTPNRNDFPGGKTNRYTYTSGFLDDRLNHNLSSCTDATGQTWLRVAYQPTNNPASLDFDAVDFIQRGPYREHLRRYRQTPSPANQFVTIKCISSDAVGNVAECFYDPRLRCARALEYTGRSNPDLPVTETSNRPKGKLRASDPDFYETRWTWNNDSLCTLVVDARGTRTSMIYEREFDRETNARKKGDLRIFREIACSDQDDDGDGVTDSLTTTFQYDPRFGSPARKGWDGTIKGRTSGTGPNGQGLRKGWDGTIKGNSQSKFNKIQSWVKSCYDGRMMGGKISDWIQNSWDKASNFRSHTSFDKDPHFTDEFITSSTDPRGTVTEASYDTLGNRVKVKFPWLQGAEADFAYNAFGQGTAITNAADANGRRRVDTADYYTNGPQAGYCRTWTIDTQGPTLIATSFEYDPRGNVTRCVDPRGNDWKFHNNQLNQRVRVESPTNITSRCVTDYLYDANNNLVQCVTELRDEADALRYGHVVAIGHDYSDRVVSVAEQVSTNQFVTNVFAYDGNNNIVAIHSPLAVSGVDPNNIVTFEYDERGLLFRSIGAPGSGASPTNQWNYDAQGNLTTSHNFYVGPNDDRIAAYDGFGRLLSVTDALSNVVTYAYDRNDNLIYSRVDVESNDVPGGAGNRRYHEWHWKYDALDRGIESSVMFFDPATQTPIGDGLSLSIFIYAPNGSCLSMTDDLGHTTTYTYDTAGRVYSITLPEGRRVMVYLRDQAGNVTAVVQTDTPDLGGLPQVFTRTNVYDSLSRCVSTSDNVGNTERHAYDSLGNVVSTVDARGNETVFAYDGLSRCVQTTCYQGIDRGITLNTSHVEYNVNSRCISATDANSNTTFHAYDSLDRPVATTNADGTTHKLFWNQRSNLVREEDANGTVITNVYDLCDRLIHRDIAAGVGVAATTTFETFAYDGLSRLVAATNDVSHSEFDYDSLGNCVRGTSGGLGAVVTFDGVGNRLSMTYPGGRVVSYTYNALNEVTGVSSSIGGLPPTTLTTFAYDGPGRVGRVSRANNANTRFQWNGLVNVPNAPGDFGWGQVSAINHQRAGGGAIIDRRVAAYDQNQNKTLRAQSAPFFGGGPLTTNVFEYDALDRLSRAINTKGSGATVRLYALDGHGNRQVVVSNGVAESYLMEATIPPGDFQMNQYTLTPFGSQTYDGNGNLTSRDGSDGQFQYYYDYADRLVAVNDLFTGSPVPVAAYAYDALGRRISKTTYPPTPLDPVTIQFVHGGGDCDDGNDTLLEVRNGGVVVATYVSAVSTLGGHSRPGGGPASAAYARSAPPLVIFGPAGGATYLHADDLGNVLALTDPSGNVFERYDYDDFGTPQFLTSDGFPMATNSSPAGNPFLFHGMEWDAKIGLYYQCQTHSDMRLAKATGWVGSKVSESRYIDPKTGSTTSGSRPPRVLFAWGGFRSSTFANNNPWSAREVKRCGGKIALCNRVGSGGDGSRSDLVKGCWIGLDADGRSAVGNGSSGVFLSRGTRGSSIGSFSGK